ncbi:MAG: prepilin-type N-terminal cleavage/methylation domain-containing protein [bacterium]
MKNRHGFTIIEAIVSMGALAIILVIVFIFFITGLKHWLGGERIIDVQNIAREIISGKGNWRGMEGEVRELHCILNANPQDTQFHLRKDKIRFIGPVTIVNGLDTICSTLSIGDDFQTIGTGNITGLTETKGITLITAGTGGTLQSIPGDIDGDGTLTAIERINSDDYVRGGFMAGGGDAVIIMGNDTGNTTCYTRSHGDDVQVIPPGQLAGIGAILITPGNNGILESVPGDWNGDGDNEDYSDYKNSNNIISSAVISYEYLPGTNTIVRKINGEKPDSKRHLGPSIIAENVATFTITYYGTDSVTIIPYGTVTLNQVNSIGLIEIQGIVSARKKGDVGKGTATATFKTKIQPRALNPAYRR